MRIRSKVVQILKDKCSECGSASLIYDQVVGETFCKDCGLVIQDLMMDKGPEWRAFTPKDKKSKTRVGAPTTYSFHDKGLSTSIGPVDRDAFGRRLPISTQLQMFRLRKWQIRSNMTGSYRNLAKAMYELDRLSDKLHVPGSIRERAAIIYRKALEKGMIQGRSTVAVVAASLYAACRVTGTPRSLREISEVSLVKRKLITRCYRLLLRRLEIHPPIIDPITFVSKIADKAVISQKAQGLAVEVILEAEKKRILAGKDPMVIAAAALYLICLQIGEKKTMKSISDAAGITDVALRKRYRSLKRQVGKQFFSQ